MHAFLGERSGLLEPETFDVVYSVSVVEHVPDGALPGFLDEGLEVLKDGGLWLHAIDLYVDNESAPAAVATQRRFDAYRTWVDHPALQPLGNVYEGLPVFSCDMASNPDNVMYQWGKVAPALNEKRQQAQSVSLLVALRKSSAA